MEAKMAKNSQVIRVKLTEFYAEAYENRECCFCGENLIGDYEGRPKVACSPECFAKARALAEKELRNIVCSVCDEPLASTRANRSALCGKEQCKKEADWRRNLYRVHKIRQEQFYKLAEEQGWACKICKDPFLFALDGSKPNLNVDHDHTCCPGRFGCGECIRGILCNGCNGGMGLFKDNPKNLIAAALYLMDYIKKEENQ